MESVEKAGVPIRSSHRALMDRLGEFPALIFACKEGAPEQGFASQAAYFGSILPGGLVLNDCPEGEKYRRYLDHSADGQASEGV